MNFFVVKGSLPVRRKAQRGEVARKKRWRTRQHFFLNKNALSEFFCVRKDIF
jgi:hypothetical protein